jgi:translation elongation factor EF-Tu-like GTPase
MYYALYAGVQLIYSLFDFTGQRFALREGGRTVGAGVVSKVMS